MRRGRHAAVAFIAVAGTTCALAAVPAPAAAAVDPVKPVCTIGGFVSGLLGKACTVLQKGAGLLDKGKGILSKGKGVLSGAGGGGGVTARAVGLVALGAWVLVGARVALHETATIIAHTTSPQLGTPWFSSTYLQMEAIAALLTLPFLFAAGVQAMIRSDLALVLRAALGYLPLALLGVSIAGPVTMLLLSASDEMCAIVSAAAGNEAAHFLARAGGIVGGLALVSGSPFIAFVIGLFTVAGAVVLWAELLMRQAAVYVVVLMLPLAFAALVWPARRVWALRAVELLVALILSKFAIVAVLALGAAALAHGPSSGITATLSGAVLVTMAAFAPWALMRLVPLAELAAGAAGALRGEAMGVAKTAGWAAGAGDGLTAALERGDDDAGEYGELMLDDPARAETRRLAELTPVPVARDAVGGAGGGPDGDLPAGGFGNGGGTGGGGGNPGGGGGGGGGGGAEPGSAGSAPGAAAGEPAGGTAAPAHAREPGPPRPPAAPGPARPSAGHEPPGDHAGITVDPPLDLADPQQRSPGLSSIFQQEDETWPVLELGLGDGWPPRPLVDPDEDDDPGEDHDPRPPAPDPEDGAL